jgi:hypothetical protein
MEAKNMEDFREEQLPKWGDFLNELFLNGIPEQYEWTNKSDIINILNKIGDSELCYTFFPYNGGEKITKANNSFEVNCIEIDFDSLVHIIKPIKLKFQSFPNADLEWSHFRLFADTLKPSGIYPNLTRNSEELTEVSPGNYINCNYQEYMGKPLPSTARIIIRDFSGDFVIFSEVSIYSGNYEDIEHYKMGEEKFLECIRFAIEHTK